MNNEYERTKLEVIRFETEDIIMDSNVDYDEYEDNILNTNH